MGPLVDFSLSVQSVLNSSEKANAMVAIIERD